MAKRGNAPVPQRSPKAGRPPKATAQTARVRRRTKTAAAAVKKGTTIVQTSRGPRAAWSASKPMWKKR
jgi:hypothetical protein